MVTTFLSGVATHRLVGRNRQNNRSGASTWRGGCEITGNRSPNYNLHANDGLLKAAGLTAISVGVKPASYVISVG